MGESPGTSLRMVHCRNLAGQANLPTSTKGAPIMSRAVTALSSSLALFCFACALHAEIKTEDVEYKDGDTVLQGYLAYDASKTDKRAGVMVVHEWWGLNDYPKQRARQLAELGYIAFAADIYGKGSVTDDP